MTALTPERARAMAREALDNAAPGSDLVEPYHFDKIAAALLSVAQAEADTEREACALIAQAHKGSATKRRKERGIKLSSMEPEFYTEVQSEERGEDIAAEGIAAAIRVRGKQWRKE